MSVRRLAYFLLLPTALLAGCASQTSRCYVTLDPAGQPTAEACETGPHLILRPLGETNAAYYVPPYVLGALRYEGFLKEAEENLADKTPSTDPLDTGPGLSPTTDDRWLGLRWSDEGGSSLPWPPSVPTWANGSDASQTSSIAMSASFGGPDAFSHVDPRTEASRDRRGLAALGPARAFVQPMTQRRGALPVSMGSADAVGLVAEVGAASSKGPGAETLATHETSLAGRLAEQIEASGMDGKGPRLGAAAGDLATAYAAGNAWRNADRVERPLSVADVLALRLPERQTIDGEIRYRRPVSYAAVHGAMLTDWPL